MDRFDPFVKYADVYGDIINWEKDPMNKPQNQNKYFFSDGKTYYEQICKMLRLMSVFKEAFNQIYSNEDEISEAWENFVNNLSASVVEGSEPDVTLTWTDDSVNFEFTMVPGVQGDPGVGITSISFNSDYTMTITLSDGNTYTSMSLKGETGPQGPQGETGSGLQILDVYVTLADLQSAHPTGQPGDAYQVGSAGNYTLYIWSSSQSAWIPAGSLGTVSPSVSNPLMDGTASAGSSDLYSRGDHVHPTDTSRASKEELDALIKTSQSLIDQSFTYRESPAIQDGLARFDKIKGNTLVWNQLLSSLASTKEWNGINITNNDDGSLTFDGTYTGTSTGNLYVNPTNMSILSTHWYLYDFSNSALNGFPIRISSSVGTGTLQGHGATINRPNADTNDRLVLRIPVGTTFNNAKVYPQIYDLTLMFGTEKAQEMRDMEVAETGSGVAYFRSLFPLSYYSYNQGSLLSFNGNGIKTVGKNLFVPYASGTTRTQNGITGVANADGTLTFTGTSTGIFWGIGDSPVFTLLKGTYTMSQTGGTNIRTVLVDHSKTLPIINIYGGSPGTFTLNENTEVHLYNYIASGMTVNDTIKVMLQFGRSVTEYEPYTSHTTNLPVSTYFPTGMKSAGTVYDELTPIKAVTRIGAVDLGSLTWTKVGAISMFYAPYNTDGIFHSGNDLPNIKTSIYSVCSATTMYNNRNGIVTDDVITVNAPFLSSTEQRIIIADTSYTDANALKTALSGVYLYYELATPTETDADLDLSFNAYENGTEQLLPVNGSVPSTSPIIADMTYLSIDDAMEYILDKLANVPMNTQQILDSLEDDVADLQTDVGALQPAVSALQTSVGNINTNIGQLSSTVAGHTSSISDMQSDITDLNTGLDNLEDTVTDNTSRIGTLESGLSNTNGNVQSISSQMQSIDGRVTNLESDLLIVVKKEYDYDSVAGNTNFGVQTGLSQEPGYKIIGIVGSEVQQGEYTSAEPWIIVTQAHVHYTSTGGVVLSMMARNVSEYTKTNVRVYLYLLCIKDTQSQ